MNGHTDWQTVAIIAGLVVSVLVSDEGKATTGESDPPFQLAEAVDTDALLKTPLLTTADKPTSLAAFVQAVLAGRPSSLALI